MTIQQVYARYCWMERFALVEDCLSMHTLAYKHLCRIERMYGDIFADVRTEVCKKFVRTSSGWAVKFNG